MITRHNPRPKNFIIPPRGFYPPPFSGEDENSGEFEKKQNGRSTVLSFAILVSDTQKILAPSSLR